MNEARAAADHEHETFFQCRDFLAHLARRAWIKEFRQLRPDKNPKTGSLPPRKARRCVRWPRAGAVHRERQSQARAQAGPISSATCRSRRRQYSTRRQERFFLVLLMIGLRQAACDRVPAGDASIRAIRHVDTREFIVVDRIQGFPPDIARCRSHSPASSAALSPSSDGASSTCFCGVWACRSTYSRMAGRIVAALAMMPPPRMSRSGSYAWIKFTASAAQTLML